MRSLDLGFLTNAFGNFPSTRVFFSALILSVILVFPSFNVEAQDLPHASVCDQGVISLPADQAVAPVYLIDLSYMSFSSDQEMISFCASFTNDDFMMRANPSSLQAVLMLQMKGRSEWSVEQWNTVLLDKCGTKPLKQ